MWTKDGGPSSAAANMAKIAFAESGDDPTIIQSGEPPVDTGYGLYQITPTSGISQQGVTVAGASNKGFGNLLNADNNTKAAISLFKAAGNSYSPWGSDPVGAGLSGATGGKIQRGGQFLVGERGPELATLPAGTNLNNAKETAQMQASKQPSQSFQNALGTGSAAGGGTNVGGITVTFTGDINIGNGSSGGTSGTGTSKYDAQHSAREFIKQVKQQLEAEDLYASIAKGNH
jgi:SLT domain-containing protein